MSRGIRPPRPPPLGQPQQRPGTRHAGRSLERPVGRVKGIGPSERSHDDGGGGAFADARDLRQRLQCRGDVGAGLQPQHAVHHRPGDRGDRLRAPPWDPQPREGLRARIGDSLGAGPQPHQARKLGLQGLAQRLGDAPGEAVAQQLSRGRLEPIERAGHPESRPPRDHPTEPAVPEMRIDDRRLGIEVAQLP